MVTTRRGNAASADALQSASQQSLNRQAATAGPEPTKKKGRRGKAATTRTESRVESQSQSTSTKTKAAPRAAITEATTSTATVSKRVTRADRAAGAGSPFRAYEQPKRQPEKKRKRTNGQTASATPEPEPAKPVSAQDENEEDTGMFFTESEQTKFLPSL